MKINNIKLTKIDNCPKFNNKMNYKEEDNHVAALMAIEVNDEELPYVLHVNNDIDPYIVSEFFKIFKKTDKA